MKTATFNQVIQGTQIVVQNAIGSIEGSTAQVQPEPAFTFEYLMYNFDQSVSAFFAWVAQFDAPDALSIFKTMITTKAKLDDFIENIFDGNFDDLYGNALRLLASNN